MFLFWLKFVAKNIEYIKLKKRTPQNSAFFTLSCLAFLGRSWLFSAFFGIENLVTLPLYFRVCMRVRTAKIEKKIEATLKKKNQPFLGKKSALGPSEFNPIQFKCKRVALLSLVIAPRGEEVG